ncbi:MAG: RluA family pseudouridine synthase [Tissierellia bacterium]|nr:RluA family pseudouridine synthase [Tissierellia bacterium]
MFSDFDESSIKIKADEKLSAYKLLKQNGISSRFLKSAFSKKLIRFKNEPIKSNFLIDKDEEIEILFERETENHLAQEKELNIIYEDCAIIVVNKESNLSMHPTKNYTKDTFLNYMAYHFKKIGLDRKVRLVNRLDFDTTGLLVVAKSPIAHQLLAKQIENDEFKRYYYGIVCGHIEPPFGIIDFEIEKTKDIKRVVTDNYGAMTKYYSLEKTSNYTLLKLNIITGRTHQIRAQMAYIGHPIVGDTLYGKSSKFIDRQALTAYKISFKHPYLNKQMEFEIDLPKDMKDLLKSDY